MKVYYLGTFEKDYSRNVIFIEAMKSVGIEVISINEEVKEKDALKYGSIVNLIKLGFKFVKAYFTLIIKLLKIKDSKCLFIGYPSHLDVIFFYLPAKLKGMKIFFNPLVSLYDTFILDRRIFRENSFISKIIYLIDKVAFSLSDIIFIDTKTHQEFLTKIFNVNASKFKIIPVGSMRDFFYEGDINNKREEFTILYVGKYIPLHGVDVIVKSAKMLENENIKFIFVGKGQLYDDIRKLVNESNISNIDFIDWMDRKELKHLIRSCHIVLGIFKGDGKAIRVVPNKVYDALASGALVITAHTPAIKEFFKDKEELILVEPDNPYDLAEKILWVCKNYDKCKEIAVKGHKRFYEIASFEVIGSSLKEIIMENWR